MTNHPSGPTPDFITVGSRICVADLDSGEEFNICLVPPDARDPHKEKLSYKTPLGSALLGYRRGMWFTGRRLRGCGGSGFDRFAIESEIAEGMVVNCAYANSLDEYDFVGVF
jgi:hypothetical protein